MPGTFAHPDSELVISLNKRYFSSLFKKQHLSLVDNFDVRNTRI